MVVLIADKLPDSCAKGLRDLGLDVVVRADLSADTLPGGLRETGASILIVRSTKVTAEVFAAAPQLSLVVRAGAGVNTIDVAAANRCGVFVANCPGKNAIAVAELTMGLVLALDRRIPDAVAEMRAGRWNKKRYGNAQGLQGRKLGIIGFGAIGREVARRALAFGLRVEVVDDALGEEFMQAHEVVRVGSIDQLLSDCDIVTVHVPYLPDTHHMIGARQIALMKPGALLIHAARGGVVDDVALGEAVRAGKIRAALDVFEEEPSAGEAAFESPLRELPGLYGTPHIGASTEQAESATAAEAVRIVKVYLQSGLVPGAVNVVTDRRARFTVTVRHRDRVGVLATVLGAMREEQLNVQEMQNVVFAGNETASATITLEREPSASLLERLRAHDDVLAVEVRAAP